MEATLTQMDCELIIEKIAACTKDEEIASGCGALAVLFYRQLERQSEACPGITMSDLLHKGAEVLSVLGMGNPSVIAYAIGYFLWVNCESKHVLDPAIAYKAHYYMSYYERNRHSEKSSKVFSPAA